MLILVSVKESALGGSKFMLEVKEFVRFECEEVINQLGNFM